MHQEDFACIVFGIIKKEEQKRKVNEAAKMLAKPLFVILQRVLCASLYTYRENEWKPILFASSFTLHTVFSSSKSQGNMDIVAALDQCSCDTI